MLAGSHLPTFVGAWRKQGNSSKTCTSLTTRKPLASLTTLKPLASLTTLKPLTVWITTNGGKEMGI